MARCIAAPSSPSSSKPEEMTTAAGMPASAASARVASTAVAGTAITARSTGPGTSTRRGHAGDAADLGDGGVHGVHGAGEAAGDDRAQHRGAHPGAVAPYPRHRDAARVEQRVEREGLGPALTLVGGVDGRGGGRGVHLDVDVAALARPASPRSPASRNTAIMPWLSPSTSATKRRSPRSRPAAARCSSSRLPSPRPCRVSSTRKLTSATPGPTGSAVPSATTRPARSTTRARVSGSAARCSTYARATRRLGVKNRSRRLSSEVRSWSAVIGRLVVRSERPDDGQRCRR